VPGDIESIDAVVTEGDEGAEPTIEIVITLQDDTGGTDGAPVDVAVTTARADDVLAVPVAALLALAEGGYAVEVVDADGTTRLVAVEPGLASDEGDLVEITGDVSEGDVVVAAA
jgi:multidrug efflux pump subunit AcrA (membrane-fusion protein)